MASPFSNFVVYVDESGDHGLTSVDPNYPVFVLAFCIFRKEEYSSTVAQAVQRFKFDFYGHDMVVLHEREIRKAEGSFKFLVNEEIRGRFYLSLNALMASAPFTLIAAVIHKTKLLEEYSAPTNPYDLALTFCLERLHLLLKHQRELDALTHIVVESRGKREDQELELAFRRICQGHNANRAVLPFEIVFAHKQCNSSGLQLADMVARPIGRRILSPTQDNRAFEILSKKFDRSKEGKLKGYGLEVFP